MMLWILILLPLVKSNSVFNVKDLDFLDKMPKDPSKFIFARNIITGERFVHDLTVIEEPSEVRRVRLMFSTSQAISSDGLIDVFHMKLRWVDPDFWNDNFTETGRSYKVLCEVEDENTGYTRTFLALTVDAAFNGYDEKYVFPRMPLLARCKVKARNGANLDSRWIFSSPVKLYELFSTPLETPESTEFISRLKHHHRNKFWTKYRNA